MTNRIRVGCTTERHSYCLMKKGFLTPSLLQPPRGSSCPGVDLPQSALLAAGCSGAGGPQNGSLYVCTPSPILLPLHPYPPKFSSPVHQNWSTKVRYIHLLHTLSVHGAEVAAGHSHTIFYILPPIMVVQTMKPQNGLLLISIF